MSSPEELKKLPNVNFNIGVNGVTNNMSNVNNTSKSQSESSKPQMSKDDGNIISFDNKVDITHKIKNATALNNVVLFDSFTTQTSEPKVKETKSKRKAIVPSTAAAKTINAIAASIDPAKGALENLAQKMVKNLRAAH